MIILDTNVVMEILEKRARLTQTLELLNEYALTQDTAVSTLTLSNVFYLLERHKSELALAESLLKSYSIVDVTAQDAAWAFKHYKRDDFEDALQIAAALRSGCSAFLTIDEPLHNKYSHLLNIKLIG